MTATPPAHDEADPVATRGPARQYGRHYRRTIGLTVNEIAALIMADLINISIEPDPDTVFRARNRFAAELFSRHDAIHIVAYGLTDHELANPYTKPADGSPCPVDYPEIIEAIANAYGWTVLHGPDDRRFEVHVTTLDEREQREYLDRIGTVTDYPHAAPAWLLP